MLARKVFIIDKLYYFQIDFLPTSFKNLSRKFPIKTKENEIHLIFSNYFPPYLLNLYKRLNVKTIGHNSLLNILYSGKSSKNIADGEICSCNNYPVDV